MCLEPLWTQGTTVFISWIILWSLDHACIQVSSIIMEWLKNPTGSRWNKSKMSSEANTQSRFWTALRHLGTHLAESFLMLKISWII
jgi:hypothetical protein